MKSGLVSIAMNCASGAIRSRIERQKVPTPGPYSTNNLVFAQSTGPSILRISRSEDGTIEPTITGCRSEEHTSELQSLMRISYAVFCLKKNKTNKESTKQQK